ncbi:MAG: glycosyl transferase family 28 [Gammaproteobacteria bacterium]
MRIHIYVQHLLGGGHLVRMQTLAAALARGGHRVTLISGGVPQRRFCARRANYRLFQLPPVKTAPGDFTRLLSADGAPLSAEFKARRTGQLLQCVGADAPHALLIETFPFGRRQLRFELLPLMRLATGMRPRPLMLCSVRDILQVRAPQRRRQSIAEAHAWFDHVLVHADPAVAAPAGTFPPARELGGKVFYSGYLHAAREALAGGADERGADGHGEVVVSAGGGAVGFELLQVALAARPHSALRRRVWRLLVGGNAPDGELRALREQAGRDSGNPGAAGIIIERSRPDFHALLRCCAVSVSQAGYNTVLDLVAAGCRAVLAPFARGGETEQTHRAETFARLGRAVMLPEPDLTPARLAAAIDRAAELDISSCRPLKMDGARESVKFIERRANAGNRAAAAAQ